MSKLYVFGIGGTGARVLKSLAMLLAAGVDLGNGIDSLVPVIIDPDKSNGDLTRTIASLKEYASIRSHLAFANGSKSNFFKVAVDDQGTGFRLAISSASNKTFADYIDYTNLSPANRALVSLLFSDKNLASSMEVGFKGNPNIGSVVLNDFGSTKNQSLNGLLSKMQPGDKIFIISSIFGGTGAAGFPLLLKTLRSASKLDIINSGTVMNAPIGAISVLPYFGLRPDDNSEIKSETFISKTKAALNYYTDNLDIDALYYICDNLKSQYENVEGSTEQRNKAHFVELAAALAVVDFCKSGIDHSSDTVFKEFAINSDADPISFPALSPSSRAVVERPLSAFFFFGEFIQHHLDSTWNFAWAKDRKLDKSFVNRDFFAELQKFIKDFIGSWLTELQENRRSFAPFDQHLAQSNPCASIVDVAPRKSSFLDKVLGKNLDGFGAIDDEVARESAKADSQLSLEDYFMSIHCEAINNVLKKKFNLI